MKSLVLYNKKQNKIRNDELVEYDLEDLESFVIFRHGEEFLEIPERKMGENTVTENLFHNGTSWWWFAAPTIHAKYKEEMLFIDRLNVILDNNNFGKLKLKGCFDKLEIIKEICNKRKIKLEIAKKEYFQFSRKMKMKNLLKNSGYKKIHQLKTKKRLNVCKTLQNFHIPSSGYVLIISPEVYRRQTYNVFEEKTENKEYFITPFIESCKQNKIPLLCLDLDYTFRGTTKNLEERMKSEVNWIPIEYILDHKKTESTKENIKNFNQLMKNFKKMVSPDIFSYDSISLWSTIEPILDELSLEPYFPTYFHVIERMEEFLKNKKPSVIIQTYEAGPYAKAIELVAKKLGIKTIALQHGLILKDTPDYFFKSIQTKETPLGNIIPDITLVFGEYYRELLMKESAYDQKNIEVFGHPEYFEINKIKSKISKDKLKEKFQCTEKTVILIPLSFRYHHIKNSPDRLLLDAVYNELKDKNEFLIIIRPHPGDKFTKQTLEEEFPSTNIRLSQESLIEDIVLADIIVSLPIGTVNTESLIFHKPIIFLNIIEEKRLEIDPIFKLLVNNKLVKTIEKGELEQTIISIKKNGLKIDINSQEIEKIINHIFNLNEIPKIEKYLRD